MIQYWVSATQEPYAFNVAARHMPIAAHALVSTGKSTVPSAAATASVRPAVNAISRTFHVNTDSGTQHWTV